MSMKFLSCLAAAIVIFSSSLLVARTLTPSDNPTQFRNSLHGNYAERVAGGKTSIPEIRPVDHLRAAKPLAGDLLISEVSSTANFVQDSVEAVGLRGGRVAAVWEDNRPGPVGIYLQLLDHSGNPLGSNASLIVGLDNNLSDPKICADTSGNFYVIWRDEASGFLQGARFDSLGNVITPVFFVSDTTQTTYAGEFNAICPASGRLIVTWENYAAENDIVFRIFQATGAPISAVTKVNSDPSGSQHWSPSAANGPNGDFAVVWEDYRNGAIPDIFFRRFNAAGVDYAAEIAISDAVPDSARYFPVIAYNSGDGYLAGWVDLRSGQNLYTQRIAGNGVLTGANVLLSSDAPQYPNWELDLGISSTGTFLAVWNQYGTGNSIMLQRFMAGAVKNGAALAVSGGGDVERFGPSVAASAIGEIAVFWSDNAGSLPDIYGAFLGNAGTFVKTAFKINDDNAGSPAFDPAVVAHSRFDWVVVFTDQRRDAGDIMLQQVYVGVTLVGVNRRINADIPGGIQTQPAVAGIPDRLLTSWTDVRDGSTRPRVYARFSKPAFDLTDEMPVDDGTGTGVRYESDNAVSRFGPALVVWTDTRSGSPHIYGQLFDANNVKSGANFLIGPATAGKTGEMATVSADSTGVFIAGYLNRLASGGPAIEVKKISGTGQVTDLFSFASDQSGYVIDGFDAGVDGSGNVSLVWHGDNAGQKQLFLTVLNQSGSVVAATRAITDNVDANPGRAAISIDPEGYVIATWLDNRAGHQTPYRQIYDPAHAAVEGNLPVYNTSAPYMQRPVTAGYRGKGFFVWSDARASGLKVYASQMLYSAAATDDDPARVPAIFSLEQNYPNPFNPTTTIRFNLAQSGQVTLIVYNLLGQPVRTLADGFLSAGSHAVVWDGTGDDGRPVASGVYLYRLSGDTVDRSRQMILMK